MMGDEGEGIRKVSDLLKPQFERKEKKLKMELTDENRADRGVGSLTLDIRVEHFSATAEVASVFHGEEEKPLLYRVRVFAGSIGGWLAVFPQVHISHEEGVTHFLPNHLWWAVSVIDVKGHSRFTQYFRKHPTGDADETDELRGSKYLEKSFILEKADELLPEDVLSLRCDIHFDLEVIEKIWANNAQKYNDIDFFSFVREIPFKSYQTTSDRAEACNENLKIVFIVIVHDFTSQNLTLPEFYPFGVHDISLDARSESEDNLEDIWMFDTGRDRFLVSLARRPGNLGRFLPLSSPVIRRCMDAPMREQGERRVQLSNVGSLAFTMVLYFLKTGRLPQCEFQELLEVYEFSHLYLMENLQVRSARCMAERCDDVSLWEEMKSLAELHSDEYLLKLLDKRRRELEHLSGGFKTNENLNVIEDRPDHDCFM